MSFINHKNFSFFKCLCSQTQGDLKELGGVTVKKGEDHKAAIFLHC